MAQRGPKLIEILYPPLEEAMVIHLLFEDHFLETPERERAIL